MPDDAIVWSLDPLVRQRTIICEQPEIWGLCSVNDDQLLSSHVRAALDKGHGLRGLADRLHAVGGRLTVTSPAGGPTTVAAELPCC